MPYELALAEKCLAYDTEPINHYGRRRLVSQLHSLHMRLGGAPGAARCWREDYEAVRLQLALMASQLFDDYYVVERALEINAQHMALLQDFQRSAEAQYIVGQAAQQDPIQTEEKREEGISV